MAAYRKPKTPPRRPRRDLTLLHVDLRRKARVARRGSDKETNEFHGHLVSFTGSIILAVALISETMITTPHVSVRLVTFGVFALSILGLVYAAWRSHQDPLYAWVSLACLVISVGVLLATAYRPNLVIESTTTVSPSEGYGATKDSQDLVCVINNNGWRPAKDVEVEISDAEGIIYCTIIGEIKPGVPKSFSLDLRLSRHRGELPLCVVVDPHNAILEWNEAREIKTDVLETAYIKPVDLDEVINGRDKVQLRYGLYDAPLSDLTSIPIAGCRISVTRGATYRFEISMPDATCTTCQVVPACGALTCRLEGDFGRDHMPASYYYVPPEDRETKQELLAWVIKDGAYKQLPIEIQVDVQD